MAARTFLDAAQIALLLDLAGLERHDASPLPVAESCALDSDAGRLLRKRGLVVDRDGQVEANRLFRAVLEAAAQPEEVLSLRITGVGAPGFTICRRDGVWTECTSAADGTTKFEYPLDREAMIAAAITGLSGQQEEAPPVGFHFRGTASDGLVLVAVAQAGTGGVARDAITGHIDAFVDANTGSALAFALADPAGTLALRDDAGPAVARLLTAGHLVEDGGAVVASRRARAVLAARAVAGFTASQVAVEARVPRSKSIQVWRAGNRNLVTRVVVLEDGSPGMEWMDVQRAELRALVAAVYVAPGSLVNLA